MVKKPRERQTIEKFELPESLSAQINVAKEEGKLTKKLQQISDESKAVLLAFIAPYGAVRVSPIEERAASIRFIDEWGVEYALSCICSECEEPNKLYLLINSPGGIPACCYNVAHMLQACFSNIKVFIPQMALSGGTLLALAGNELVMGLASRLSPMDVQVTYSGTRVSAYAMGRALSRLDEYFRTKRPEEAPYPWRAMADKLDAVILEDWTTTLLEIGGYAAEILEAAGYPEEKCRSIIKALVLTEKTHSFVIHKDRAKALGLNVSKEPKDMQLLSIMRNWLGEYAFEKEVTHCIRYVVPKGGQPSEKDKDRHTNKGNTAERPTGNSGRKAGHK